MIPITHITRWNAPWKNLLVGDPIDLNISNACKKNRSRIRHTHRTRMSNKISIKPSGDSRHVPQGGTPVGSGTAHGTKPARAEHAPQLPGQYRRAQPASAQRAEVRALLEPRLVGFHGRGFMAGLRCLMGQLDADAVLVSRGCGSQWRSSAG